VAAEWRLGALETDAAMLGPVDLQDWGHDAGDELSLLLRRHRVILSIAGGADPDGQGAPAAVRNLALAFARQEHLVFEDLRSLADGLELA
jgi:hypothetical protein